MKKISLLILTGLLAACSNSATSEISKNPMETISLPAPSHKGKVSVEEALKNRRSYRNFTKEELTDQEISQILWATQGLNRNRGRTAPSAGALYPLEVYVALPSGFYHYSPKNHSISLHEEGDKRPAIHKASLSQGAILNAPAVMIISAVHQRTAKKYGGRAERYIAIEVGHAAQNAFLQATAMGLGGVPIGAFNDGALQKALTLPEDHEPLYVIPIGHPK